MFGIFAIVAASLFAGVAIYVSVVEHPARMTLPDAAALQQWQESYPRAALMQGSLALIGFVLGILEWMVTGRIEWLFGALLLVANWPVTYFWIMPTNRALQAREPETPGVNVRSDLEKWAQLHLIRTGLGSLAALVFIWAAM
jgi:hypothetical protein